MRRWFTGFTGGNNYPMATLPEPIEGSLLWGDSRSCFWACGSWKGRQIISISQGLVRLAIIGSCFESYENLAKLLQNLVAKGEYSRMMSLPGNYNLIVQDNNDTYIFSDVTGVKSVFYAVYDSLVVYSSLGIALQQLLQADLDRSWLATFLSGSTTLSLGQNRTPFCEVKPIPPGHYLHISPEKLRCERYWYGPPKHRNFSDAAEQLREQLTVAVEGRIHLYGNVTSDLSGGFDSTTLALIAAKKMAENQNKLHTLTLKTVSATQSSDFEYAQHAANLYSSIDSIVIENQEPLEEYSSLKSFPLTDVPSIVCLAIGQLSKKMEILKSVKSRLHMAGDGGDAVLSASYPYCADLLIERKFLTFFQHINGWSRVNRCSLLSLFKSVTNLSFTSYHQWLFQEIEQLKTNPLASKHPIDRAIVWSALPEFAAWHSKDCVSSVIEELQKWAEIAKPLVNLPGEHKAMVDIQLNGLDLRADQQIADLHDINLEFPYLDTSVIDACLSANSEDRTSPYKYKPLLPRAFLLDLPQTIFKRNTKGDYTADLFTGFRKNKAAIDEIFQDSILVDMEMIDIEKLRDAMQKIKMGFYEETLLFDHTLALEIWLHRLTQTDEKFWLQEEEKVRVST